MPSEYQIKRMGWLPAPKDNRDFSPTESVSKLLGRKLAVPTSVDNTKFCTPIEDQQDLGSCTAFATIGMIEYLHKKVEGKSIDLSQLFLYKMTRTMMGWTGDTGAYMRNAIGALVRFGAPENAYWPYDTRRFEEMPPWHIGALADDFQALTYFRLDYPNLPKKNILDRINSYVAKGWPVMLGFNCYESLRSASVDQTGEIPFPEPSESVIGGHAVMVAGYDTSKKIGRYTGAWKIRNSWGTGWGQSGYGWLPFQYFLSEPYALADDFWSLTKAEWTDSSRFEE